MVTLALVVLTVFLILCLSELGWRKNWLANEVGRKFVHIIVGSFVAFWPFFLSWNQIRFLSLAFLFVVIVSSYFNIFHAISSVQRPTYGEVFFAVTVGLLTYVTQHKGLYAAAILQMSIADGLAAIVGTRYGKSTRYFIFGHAKSLAGTGTFFMASLAILLGYSIFSSFIALPILITAALFAAIMENAAVLGFDNLVVPLFIGLLLVHL